jgi:AraC-like DNA-binding protein
VEIASRKLPLSPLYNLLRSHIANLVGLAPTLSVGQSTSLAEILRRQPRKIRRAAAHELFASRPTLPNGVVTHRCGFVDPTHSSRIFHHKYVLTPRQLRKALIEPSPPRPALSIKLEARTWDIDVILLGRSMSPNA